MGFFFFLVPQKLYSSRPQNVLCLSWLGGGLTNWAILQRRSRVDFEGSKCLKVCIKSNRTDMLTLAGLDDLTAWCQHRWNRETVFWHLNWISRIFAVLLWRKPQYFLFSRSSWIQFLLQQFDKNWVIKIATLAFTPLSFYWALLMIGRLFPANCSHWGLGTITTSEDIKFKKSK